MDFSGEYRMPQGPIGQQQSQPRLRASPISSCFFPCLAAISSGVKAVVRPCMPWLCCDCILSHEERRVRDFPNRPGSLSSGYGRGRPGGSYSESYPGEPADETALLLSHHNSSYDNDEFDDFGSSDQPGTSKNPIARIFGTFVSDEPSPAASKWGHGIFSRLFSRPDRPETFMLRRPEATKRHGRAPLAHSDSRSQSGRPQANDDVYTEGDAPELFPERSSSTRSNDESSLRTDIIPSSPSQDAILFTAQDLDLFGDGAQPADEPVDETAADLGRAASVKSAPELGSILKNNGPAIMPFQGPDQPRPQPGAGPARNGGSSSSRGGNTTTVLDNHEYHDDHDS